MFLKVWAKRNQEELAERNGIYARDATGPLAFHGAPSPNREDLEGVVRIVHRRALRWLARHDHLERPPLEKRSNEATAPSPIEACAAIATQRGTMRTLAPNRDSPQVAREALGVDADAPAREGGAVDHEGFNLHASVRIAAEDDRGRERLCRYGRVLRSRSGDSGCFLAAASPIGSRSLVLVGQNMG
jgi:hypothetical protein